MRADGSGKKPGGESPSKSKRHFPYDREAVGRLADFIAGSQRLLVLTGAGCSTESGIPDYRDEKGDWKRRPPIQLGEFLRTHQIRQRYWARSTIGWRVIASARPNAAHRALARLETQGRIHHLITQNVDCLHQKAGSRLVIDLHGRLDTVVCVNCSHRLDREEFQEDLESRNPGWLPSQARVAPDGDVDLAADYSRFEVPCCPRCKGVLKPEVVFFGEGVPRRRSVRALHKLEQSDGLLIVGSSLMVWSGYRFARRAAELGLPIAAINLGRTRADDLLQLKLNSRAGEVLPRVVLAAHPIKCSLP